MKIAFFGDSLTEGFPGASYLHILGQKLPDVQLLNYGKGGDTALSLFRRIRRLSLPDDLEASFIWVGVNDVFVHTSWIYPLLKRIRNQPWARDLSAFRTQYSNLLEHLAPKTRFLFTVSPLFIGEDLKNRWNQELEKMSDTIKEISSGFRNIEYIDLRGVFSPLLSNEAASQGQHYTLDGVHLNSRGAGIVADVFLESIGKVSSELKAVLSGLN
ncbi:SGNH/GDSL hydrolase family protein [Acidobacteriota bacterium]